MTEDEQKVCNELVGLVTDSHDAGDESSVIVGTCGNTLLTSIGEFEVTVRRLP